MMCRQSLRWLSLSILVVLLAGLALACAAPVPQTVTVKETVVVEKPVEKQVEKIVEKVVTATPAPKSADAKTILRVGTGDSGEGLNPHQEIIGKFEDANKDILVQLEAVAGRDYYARLLTQIAAGDAPDVMHIGDDAVPMFVDKGALVPLDDYIKGPTGVDLKMYLPGVLAPGQYKGKQYLLPKDFSTMGVYYNKKIFDKYGLKYPESGWTWDDFLKTAQALTKDTNGDGKPEVWGIQLPATFTTGFEYFVGAAGGKLISEVGK